MRTSTEKVSVFAGTPVEKLAGFWAKYSKPIISNFQTLGVTIAAFLTLWFLAVVSWNFFEKKIGKKNNIFFTLAQRWNSN